MLLLQLYQTDYLQSAPFFVYQHPLLVTSIFALCGLGRVSHPSELFRSYPLKVANACTGDDSGGVWEHGKKPQYCNKCKQRRFLHTSALITLLQKHSLGTSMFQGLEQHLMGWWFQNLTQMFQAQGYQIPG